MSIRAIPESVDFPGDYPHSTEEKMVNFLKAVLTSMRACCSIHYVRLFGVRAEDDSDIRAALTKILDQLGMVSETLAINSQNLQLITRLLQANIYVGDYKGRVIVQHSSEDYNRIVYAIGVNGRYFAAEPVA